ncbi:MAG TPA: hypothetical protein VGR51_10260, partial [Thermoplasmata archaeon]|nr:hypothetical protein [Thermoplasmata archaeon]
MAIGVAILVLVVTGSVLVPGRGAGPTVECGHVTTSTTWTSAESPYLVTCDLIVDRGVGLTIQPGTTVLVDPGYSISIQGYLAVGGAPNAPVVFDSNASSPAPGDWGGLRVEDYGFASLYEARIAHAVTGVRGGGVNPTGQGGTTISQSEISDNSAWGVDFGSVQGYGTVGKSLTGVYVHDNGGGVNGTGPVYVTGSRIVRNAGVGIRIVASDRGSLYLNGSVVADNGGSGVEVTLAGSPPPPYQSTGIVCNDLARNGLANPNSRFGVDLVSPNASLFPVFRNNFVDNGAQARDEGANAWDDGTQGNFWSDYPGTDADGDGFGDVPYVIDSDSVDRHPFIARLPGCPPMPTDDAPSSAGPIDARLAGGSGRPDVALSWRLSADDGAGEDDIDAYLLYESTTYERAGAGYTLLATLPPGTTSYSVSGAGLGDPDAHYYRLVVRDTAGQTTASADQFSKYVRRVAAGAQLLSVPIAASDRSVDNVLRTVDYELARTYVNPAG